MTKRRSPGEGGCWSYKIKAGERFHARGPVKMPDGTIRMVSQKGFVTKKSGLEWLHGQQAAGSKGEFIEPSRQQFGDYGREVIEGLCVEPQTRASYLKNWRNHVEPYPLANIPLATLTGVKLTSHYRQLETSGRKDHRAGEGLSARTVRYIHTIIHGVLKQAVDDGLLARNPAKMAKPPTAKQATAPEMHPWTAAELAAFLAWSVKRGHSGSGRDQSALLWHCLWTALAMTGMRRGEALALRWRDLDTTNTTLAIRRSAGIVRTHGEGAVITEGTTKSGKVRVVDLDKATLVMLVAYRRQRGLIALQLARDDALIFGDLEGQFLQPEHVSRQFGRDVARCGSTVVKGGTPVPVIRLHDLRHTHATLLLLAGKPPHVVSQRLGHTSPVITMTIYAHVMPGNQKDAADTFARLLDEAGDDAAEGGSAR